MDGDASKAPDDGQAAVYKPDEVIRPQVADAPAPEVLPQAQETQP